LDPLENNAQMTLFIKMTENKIWISPDSLCKKNLNSIDILSNFIDEFGIFDVHYIQEILIKQKPKKKILQKKHDVTFLIPEKYTLQIPFQNETLPSHQQERLIMELFLESHEIDIQKYEFLFIKEKKKAFAIKKNLLENRQQCFEEWPLRTPFKWLICD
jgi:hypothetical protein